MKIPGWAKIGLMRGADAVTALTPRPRPSLDQLRACRFIAHRGSHDIHHGLRENTLASFEAAAAAGLWAIEFDIRWTRDDVPVVHHDEDTSRVFGRRLLIRETAFAELRQAVPGVPTLEEVVETLAGRIHFMIELKNEPRADDPERAITLGERLARLEPVRDFHVMSLRPELLKAARFAPPESRVTIAETNTAELRELTVREGYAALTGHYLLIGNDDVKRVHARGARAGTGFVDSRNCLWRELNRGIDWIFSNRARDLQSEVSKLIGEISGQGASSRQDGPQGM